MSPERWAQIREIFDEVLSLEPAERDPYVRRVCGEDAELRDEVMRLIADAAEQSTEVAAPPQPRRLGPGGTLSGRYRIERVIGRGGMGEVYAAVDSELGDRVAIKTVVQDKVDEQSFERLRRELRLTRRLTHPNICRVFDIGRDVTEDGSVLFFTMELLAGETIHERIRRKGRMAEAEALEVLRQVGAALEAAHGAGVVHRDLKPANVMLVGGEGQAQRAVVMDFGIARSMEGGGGADPYATMTGNLIGTPAYMAPEQLEGKPATPATDMYALGLILYETLTGRKAFPSGNTLAAALERLRVAPGRPSTHVPDMSAGWERAILHCLEREPEKRPRNVGEVLREIEAGQGRKARPVWARRSVAAVVMVGALAGVGWMMRDGWPKTEPPVRRVAVLPFAGAGGVDAYLAAGFAGSVGDRLAAAARNGPLAWVTTTELEQQGARVRAQAARSLGVTEAIEGELRRDGERYVAKLALTRVADGSVLGRWTLDGRRLEELAVVVTNRLSREFGLPAWRAEGKRTPPEGVLRGLGYLPGEPAKAMEVLQESIEREGPTVEAHLGMARAGRIQLARTKDGAWGVRAGAALDGAERLAPGDSRVYLERAELYLAQRKAAEALDRLEAARVSGLDSAELSLALASAYVQLGLPDKAEVAFRTAIAKDKNLWTAFNRFGVFYTSRGRYEEAAAQFREAVRIAPNNPQLLSNLGGVMLHLGRYAEAEQYLRRSVQLEPKVAALINLGAVSSKQRQWAAAAEWYERALEKDPSNHKIWESLAKAYERLPGQKDKARDAFLRAEAAVRKRLRETPDEPAMLSDLAAYLAFTGTRRDALETIQRALALAPGNVDVMMVAAEVYESLGFRTEALDWVKRALEGGFPREAVAESLGLEELRKDKRFSGSGGR